MLAESQGWLSTALNLSRAWGPAGGMPPSSQSQIAAQATGSEHSWSGVLNFFCCHRLCTADTTPGSSPASRFLSWP
jgi:hypothetical protein